jgi:energy-coupling factor transport system ATP-binding protein
MAGIGEVIGTGLLGAMASAWLVGPMFMGKSMAVATLVIAFSISSAGGAILGVIALKLLKRVKIWHPESK